MIGLIAWTQYLIHFQLKCPCNQDAQQNDPDPYPAKKRDHPPFGCALQALQPQAGIQQKPAGKGPARKRHRIPLAGR